MRETPGSIWGIMISRHCNVVLGSFVLASIVSVPAMAKTIDWCGYTWQVRDGGGGPGPNTWSADNVSIDAQKRLHLKIAKRDGKWSCAELTMTKALGFGRYEFDADNPILNWDNNVVFGLFNYPTADVGPDGTNEIDIEFATWGGAQNSVGNWTVWPPSTRVKGTTHPVPLSGAVVGTVNTFDWTDHSISFYLKPILGSGTGIPDKPRDWEFTPDDFADRIPQHPLPVHMNLWLFNGKPPTDDKDVEIVVSGFKFTSQGGA